MNRPPGQYEIDVGIILLRQSPGQVAQLVRASSQNTKVEGSIPGQGTYKTQPMNARTSGTTN